MECKKWESDGLLYVAGELQDEASAEFENHLTGCEVCSRELEEYREMFGEFNAEELLAVEPSAECDARVIAAMESTITKKAESVVTMGGIFTMLLKRVAVPVAIFAVAVTVGFQISHNTGTGESQMAKSKDSSVVEEKSDTTSDSGRIFIQGGGSGVIPVTLEE